MLIDGGGLHSDRFDLGKNVIAPFLWKKKIGEIDYLVLTHPDPDHLKGLPFIASRFSIGQFWDNGSRAQSEAYFQLKKAVQENGIEGRSMNAEAAPLVIHGARVSFLNPEPKRSSSNPQPSRPSVNNDSLVIRIHFKSVVFLLAADIEKEAEERLMRTGYPLKAHVLKIPHHGSASSSTFFFTRRVSPAYGILSVGEENIGKLPHPEVLQRYNELGTRVFRTDRHGAITVITDGEKIEVNTFR
jgi:competence protein ComEC